MPNGRCQVHGGKTPTGLALPQTKHGRYSKSLPVRLAARFAEAATDPELLSQREDIALLDARLADVLDAASNQESGELWQSLNREKRKHQRATGREKDTQQQEALDAIFFLIGEGYNERQSWNEIRSILQERRQLVESERKRLAEMGQMITAEKANIMLGAVAHIFKSTMADVRAQIQQVAPNDADRIVKGALQAIGNELGQLVNHGA